jgi:peptidoglycan/LPS O-acetylase OafA/YrhL
VSFQDQLFAALFLMQVPWLRDVVINSPSWSISAEFYAYLLFPLIVPFILQLRGHRVVLVGTALILGIVVNHLVNSHNQTTQGWGALLRALPEFAAGIFAYRVYAERLFRTFLEKDVSLAGIAAVIIAVCIANASDGVVVPLLLLLLLAAVCNSGRMAGYLNLRPLRWLGEVSYSVYIFQIPSLTLAVGFSGTLIAHGLGGTRFIALAAALALAAGVLVHRCVDVPARAALRRLPSRVAAFAIAYSGNHDLSAHPGAGATVAPRSAGSPAKEKRQ